MEAINDYYRKLQGIRELYMSHRELEGVFNFERLEIGMDGPPQLYDSLGYVPNALEEQFKNIPPELLHGSMNDVMTLSKEMKLALQYIQVLFHEAIHILQTLTLRANNEYVYWLRQFWIVEFEVFRHHIQEGYQWKIKSNIINQDTKKWLYSNNSEELGESFKKHFFQIQTTQDSYEYDYSLEINTLDIVEGQAFVFQELVTDAIDRLSKHISKDSVYKKALYYFLSNNGNSGEVADRHLCLIFILICQMSLRFGKTKSKNHPQRAGAIFQHLCQHKQKYFKVRFIHFFSNPSLSIQNWLTKYNQDIYKLSTDEKRHFLEITTLQDKIEKDVLNYFRTQIYNEDYFGEKEDDFYDYIGLLNDGKMESLFTYYKEKNPGFDSKYFLCLLIASPKRILPNFLDTTLSDEIESLTFISPYDVQITMETDFAITELFSDFKRLLFTEKTYCCHIHKETNDTSTLYSCNETNSLRKRIKALFGNHIELKDLIICQ